MRFVEMAILCSAVWSSMHVQAGAVGKITVDPNAPGAKAAATAPETDARLAQKVTYEAKRKTILAILTDLSKMTDATLRAGYNNQDWQVRDRKMNIFAKEVSLADLMSSVARVMKFKWSRSEKDGVYSYRLYMDRKTLLDAEAQKARSDERILEQMAEQREKVINSFLSADQLSNQDLARMKSEKPFSYVLASTGMAGGLGKLIRSFPALSEAMATGQEITVAVSQLPTEGQQGLSEFFNGARDFCSRMGSNVGNWLPEDVSEVTLSLRQGDISDGELARLWYRCGNVDAYTSLFNPDGKFAQALGKACVDFEDGKGGSFEEINLGTTPEMVKAAASDVESFDPGESPTEHPDDPALLKKIKIDAKSNLLKDVQSALAESTGFAIVSDSFGNAKCLGSVRKDEAETKTLLDDITKSSYYNWDKYGSVIEFRDRYWFKKRSAQIPESWIEVWRQTFKKAGTLDISDLAQIAALTQEQVNINIDGDEVLTSTAKSGQSLTTLIMLEQDVLRAYDALTESERNKLFSSSGLDIREVSPDRRADVEKPIARRNAEFLLNSDAQIIMRGKCVQQGKQLKYTLTATTSDAINPIVWTFTTPKYEPPKETMPAGSGQAIQNTTDR